MLPRLAAEDLLDRATATGLGTGSIKDAERMTRNLMTVAKGESRPRSGGLNAGALALMGIKVEIVGSSDG